MVLAIVTGRMRAHCFRVLLNAQTLFLVVVVGISPTGLSLPRSGGVTYFTLHARGGPL